RIERSRSRSWCTPIASPYNPNDPEEVEKDLRVEREAYEELVGDNGRPCYPIELGLEVFNNPGQYKGILEYWQDYESGARETTKRWVFLRQLECWKGFREFQQENRDYFESRNRFPEFQQQVCERRRRYGLDGDVQLLKKQDKQSKLDDWMEYQDYELQLYDFLEKDFKKAVEELASCRKALAEAGISAFEGVQELAFASEYSLTIEYNKEKSRAQKKMELAERRLRLAEKRLEVTGSDNLGESVERATWVKLFLKEVEIAQMRLDELQRLADDARRELEPHNSWFYGRQIAWGEQEWEGPKQGEPRRRPECDSTEFKDRMKKLAELERKNHEARMARFRAKEEVKFAEEGYDAARLDNIGETFERAALIKMAQEEVRSAETQVEESKEPLGKIRLKGAVISALGSIPLTRGKVKRHNVLLEWIERQRQEMAGGRANIEKDSGRDQSKEASSRVLRNHPIINKASRLKKPPRTNGHKQKQSAARLILSPVNPTKISKASSKRRSSRRKLSVSRGALQRAEKMTIDSIAPQYKIKQAFKIKDAMPPSLRSTHSSKVCKPGGKRLLKGLRRGSTKSSPTAGTPRQTRKNDLGRLSTGKKSMQQSANASLRRSTRISKRPERFRPGYT
ncbi:MAG: hypothetical protein Q9196_006068, partial [Gyalolechia fulgens]